MQNDFNLSFLILFISFAPLSNLHRRTENLFKEVRKRRLNSVLQIKSTPKPCLRSSLYFVYLYPDFECILPQINYMITKTKKYKV